MYNYTDEELNEILAECGIPADVDNEEQIVICEIDNVWELEGVYYAD